MKFKANSIDLKYDNGKTFVVIETSDRVEEALSELHGSMEITIDKPRKSRSLDANSYAWVLCDEIAKKLSDETGGKVVFTKEQIYRNAIKEVGIFTDVCVPEDSIETLKNNWDENGKGYFLEILRKAKIPNCLAVRLYYGTHSYNTKEFARVLDYLVEDARGIGVVTKGDLELERLLKEWEKD